MKLRVSKQVDKIVECINSLCIENIELNEILEGDFEFRLLMFTLDKDENVRGISISKIYLSSEYKYEYTLSLADDVNDENTFTDFEINENEYDKIKKLLIELKNKQIKKRLKNERNK